MPLTDEERRARQRESERRYQDRNREAINARARRWRQANPEKARESERRWRQANPERVQERDGPRKRERYTRDRVLVLAHYSPTDPPSCACCGRTDQLTIDHVEGDGQYHRWLIFGPDGESNTGSAFYAYLVREGYPNDPPLQVLCIPCNASKGGGNGCRLDHTQRR